MSRVVKMYECPLCRCPLERGRVISIAADNEGSVLVRYVCECSAGELGARYRFVVSNLAALVGTPLVLPYEANPRPRPVQDDDPGMVLWRWELDQLASWDELVEWLNLTAAGESSSPPAGRDDESPG